MYSAEDMLEEKDDFHEYYQQYRPRNRSSYSPVDNSNFIYPRRVYTGSSETATESFSDTFSSGYSSGQAGNNREGHYGARRIQPSHRSKSQGRDHQRADLMSFYHSRPRTAESEQLSSYANHFQASPEDTLSRDSGHSSGGTPEFGRRSIVRYNSFPQPRQVTRAEVSSNNDELGEEQFAHSTGRPFDSYSLYGAQPEHTNNLNCDSMSLHSFDAYKQNWRYMEERQRPKITPRRKYNAPEQHKTTDVNMNTTNHQKNGLRAQNETASTKVANATTGGYTKMVFVAIGIVILFGIWVMLLTTYNKWRCSSENSKSIDIETLASKLSSNLIGQHLASNLVVSHMKIFSESVENNVLVLLLIGMTGSGKTHTTNLISQMFPIQSNIYNIPELTTQPQAISDIPRLISQSCGYSLVVVDDVNQDDKMIINSLEKLIVSLSNDSNSKSKGTLVVVSTKTSGENINKFLLELSKDNLSKRDKVTTEDIMNNLKEEDTNIPLHQTLMDYNIPVTIIPFLPLTRDHVRECISNHLKLSNAQMNPKEINFMLDKMSFFSPDFPIFSKYGCRQVSMRVNAVVGGKREL